MSHGSLRWLYPSLIRRSSLHVSLSDFVAGEKTSVLTLKDGDWQRVPRAALNRSQRFMLPRNRVESGRTLDPSTATNSRLRGSIQSKTVQRGSGAPSLTAVQSSIDGDLNGVPLPRKPRPPASDECCMSGCARCVFDLYAEDLLEFQDNLIKVRTSLTAKGVPSYRWPALLREGAEDTVEDARRKAEEQSERETATMGVAMKEFLRLERRIRKRNYERMVEESRLNPDLDPPTYTSASSIPTRGAQKPA